MQDVLSEVLATLELESAIYFRAELSSPFSIAVPESPGVIRFHVASEGSCTLAAEGHEPLAFGPGDLVMVPHGSEHVLSDAAHRPAEPLPRVLDQSGFDGVGPLVYGGGGARTTLVCGHFAFSPAVTHPFVASLPWVLHLRRGTGTGYAWVEQLLAHTEEEARRRSSGWHGIVERLAQILLVYVLRAHLEQGDAAVGALGALSDPQLARAVEAMHARPAEAWTLDALASQAHMSRSSFVRRFRAACGLAPMRYLALWRMQRARFLLANSELSAGEVSAKVGYESESAFYRAFKECFGTPPASYRRRSRLERPAPTGERAGAA